MKRVPRQPMDAPPLQPWGGAGVAAPDASGQARNREHLQGSAYDARGPVAEVYGPPPNAYPANGPTPDAYPYGTPQPPLPPPTAYALVPAGALSQPPARSPLPSPSDAYFVTQTPPQPPRTPSALSHALIALAAMLLIGAAAYALFPRRTLAYEVWLGKRAIGIVRDRDALDERIEALRDNRSAQYGIDVHFASTVEYRPIHVSPDYITGFAELIAAYDALADIEVRAAAILIEDEVVAATTSLADSQWVIDKVLEPYEALKARNKIERYALIEDVRIDMRMVPDSIVMSKEDIYHRLVVGTDEVHTVTVQEGESIHTIAKANGLTIADLKKANPQLLASDVVRAGQELSLIVPQSTLNVRYYSRVDDVIDLPFKTIVEYDSKKYVTQKEVKSPGQKGQQKVVAEREYIAGVIINETILERQILTQAQDQKVVKGTKAVAKKSSGSTAPSKYANVPGFVENEVSVDGFSWPSSGRLSSQYGLRWSRQHSGIDIATPKGTPVYASRAGTVIFSGYSGDYGSLVKIDNGDGIETRYAHNSKLLVKKGDKVERGQLIALSGNSGKSTGPHVHFEIRYDNVAINPLEKLPAIN